MREKWPAAQHPTKHVFCCEISSFVVQIMTLRKLFNKLKLPRKTPHMML